MLKITPFILFLLSHFKIIFAGYGLIEGIASADEMIKSYNGKFSEDMIDRDAFQEKLTTQCEHCGTTNKYHRKDCPNFGT